MDWNLGRIFGRLRRRAPVPAGEPPAPPAQSEHAALAGNGAQITDAALERAQREGEVSQPQPRDWRA